MRAAALRFGAGQRDHMQESRSPAPEHEARCGWRLLRWCQPHNGGRRGSCLQIRDRAANRRARQPRFRPSAPTGAWIGKTAAKFSWSASTCS